MKKTILLASVLISAAGLQACSTTASTGAVSPYDKEVRSQPLESISQQGFNLPVEPASGATVTDSVHVSPSYYSYETSDMSTSERKALSDILMHLQDADALIRTAEAQQSNDQRIKFRYDWLRKDLYKITRGISDHLSSPESQPRAFEPIVGDYRR